MVLVGKLANMSRSPTLSLDLASVDIRNHISHRNKIYLLVIVIVYYFAADEHVNHHHHIGLHSSTAEIGLCDSFPCLDSTDLDPANFTKSVVALSSRGVGGWLTLRFQVQGCDPSTFLQILYISSS